ncbi:MAG TPA: histidinol-phosphate transaminase [Kiritimatiellia bacterium]|nr:histidinol-phosphate transaminase [Kiritimatiellia bacterium]
MSNTMDLKTLANTWIPGLNTYQPGRPIEEVARELGLGNVEEMVKLASNENSLGPSPKAVAAMRAAAEEMHIYPDGDAFYLRQALAKRLGVGPGRLAFGHGSNELIALLGQAFLNEGSSIVISQYAFVVYELVASLHRAKVIRVPARDFGHDLVAMRAAIEPSTKLVFVANPNNPTGTMVSGAELERFVRSLPEHVALVLDEAYVDLLEEEDRPDALAWVNENRKVFVLRTFSKGYGLAGVRIGYAVAPEAGIDLINRVRQPFNVNAMAQVAALAALEDEEHLVDTRRMVREGLVQVTEGCRAMGLEVVPSRVNFVLVRVGDGKGVFEALQRRKVIVRPVGGYGLPEFIRVTVGTAAENRMFLAALPEVLAETGCAV